jgi:hypothetical protein
MRNPKTPVSTERITRVDKAVSEIVDDILVAEEPLEIRLGHGPEEDRKEVRLSVNHAHAGE